MLNRIKAKLFNTELRIEYILPEEGASNRGLAIIIKVGRIAYENEAGKELKMDGTAEETASSQLDKDFDEESMARGANNRSSRESSKENKPVYYLSEYAMHHISLEDISVYTEEFTIVETHRQQMAKSPTYNSSDAFLEESGTSDRFYSTMSEFPLPSLQPFNVPSSSGGSCSSNASTTGDEDESSEGGGGGSSMKIYSSGEMQIAALNGPLEIRLSMKQSEAVLGPNVELEVNLGVLELLLTPRQCHMFSVVLDSFSATPAPPPATPAGSEKQPGKQQSTLRKDEFGSEFRSQFNNMSGGFTYQQSHHHQDWPPMPSELRSNLNYTAAAPDVDSLMSSSSSMSSSMSSASTMVTRNSSRSRRTVTMSGQEYDSVPISKYMCWIGGIVGVLLHDDVLMDTQSSAVCYGPPLTEASCQQMKILASNFFATLKKTNMVAELRNLVAVEAQLDALVPQYHLRLILATISLEGEERRNPKENLLHFNASIARARFIESLAALKVPLFDFPRATHLLPAGPDLQLTYQSLQKVHFLNGIEYLSEPAVKCRLNVAPCLIEVDISVYDRLKVLSESYPFQLVVAAKVAQKQQQQQQQPPTTRSHGSSRRRSTPSFNLKLDFEVVDVHLRFPVADLRPVHDPQRVPWWERNVRPDYLVLQFRRARVANIRTDILSVECDELLLFFVENDTTIPLGSCSSKVDSDTQTNHCPTILIDLSEKSVESQQQERSNPQEGLASAAPPPSPFARSKTCRESDTPHKRGPTAAAAAAEDSEVLVMPGNRQELHKFTEFVLRHSRTRVTIDLPSANVQLKSKHVYELLYNRINSDLLLWTPGSHQLVVPASGSAASDLLFHVGLMDSVYAPSVSQDISASDEEGHSSEDDSDADGRLSDSDELYAFKSFNQRRRRRRHRRRRRKANAYDEKQTNECEFAFCLQVDEVVVRMFPPARNAYNQVIPEQHGELVLQAHRLKLLSVKGFCGNENLGYVCLDADNLSASHCGLSSTAPSDAKHDEHLLRTIYRTPDLLTLNGIADHQSSRKMLSLAMQLRLCPEQEMKRLRLAAVVHTATLKHNNPTIAEQSWLMELMDMFDVLDYPIPGYKPNGVITEMHIHLWDCAVDYRPLYFPFRAVATLGNLEISTNITTPSLGCTLRFVAEDSALSLGPQLLVRPCTGEQQQQQRKAQEAHERAAEEVAIFNDKRDLVCVLELGLFEISLRLSDKETSLAPKFDLRAAVHDVHIRTCSDSARALAEFLAYVAAEGDLTQKWTDDEEEDEDLLHDRNTGAQYVDNETQDLLATGSGTVRLEKEEESARMAAEVAQSKQLHVTNLMEEAMIESHRGGIAAEGENDDEEDDEGEGEDDDEFGNGTEVFFFPDEASRLRMNREHDPMTLSICQETLENRAEFSLTGEEELGDDDMPALPQVQEDLGEIPSYPSTSRHSITPVAGQRSNTLVPRMNSSDADEDYCIIGDEEKVAFVSTLIYCVANISSLEALSIAEADEFIGTGSVGRGTDPHRGQPLYDS